MNYFGFLAFEKVYLNANARVSTEHANTLTLVC